MNARMPLVICLISLSAGCSTPTESIPPGARTVRLEDFTKRSDVTGSHVVEMPASVTAPPTLVEETRSVVIGDTTVTETVDRIESVAPDGTMSSVIDGPIEFDETVRPGVLWPVDGLVGQINGRPVFAAEFFLPIQDRLAQLGLEQDLVTSRRAIIQIVRERFMAYVNSELIIAEAESELTPEMQQGIFGWLGMMEEEVTAQRGGTRFEAEQSIMAETGMTLEEFLQQQRNLGLAGQLLRKRVEPRAIVSWRDIEQEYRARIDEFRPAGSVIIGRILLLNSRDSEKIATVTKAFENGSSFAEVAAEIGLEDGGRWRTFELGEDGIAGIEGLRTNIRESLVGLPVNAPSPMIEGRTSSSWYAVLGFDTPPSRSIFDPDVQLMLRNQISSLRYSQQEARYLDSLRRRWVNDDIRSMEIQLVELALRRYWQGD